MHSARRYDAYRYASPSLRGKIQERIPTLAALAGLIYWINKHHAEIAAWMNANL